MSETVPGDAGSEPAEVAPRHRGRVAIVTGASRGIGLEIARRLVAEGAKVTITARKAGDLAAAAADLADRGAGPAGVLWSAGSGDDPRHQDETVAATMERFGAVDLLVNNTGINPVYGPLAGIDLDACRKILEVNLLAALAWVQKVHAAWMAERGGAVLNVASVAGLRPAPGLAMYGTSKAALIHLTEELAVELGPRVRVNAVAPAVVKTRFAGALYEGKEAEMADAYPLGRLGVPEDIAAMAAFLLSDDASWVTGQTVVADGGVTLTGGL